MMNDYEEFRGVANDDIVRSLRDMYNQIINIKHPETETTPKKENDVFEEYIRIFNELFENISLDLEIKLIDSESKKLPLGQEEQECEMTDKFPRVHETKSFYHTGTDFSVWNIPTEIPFPKATRTIENPRTHLEDLTHSHKAFELKAEECQNGGLGIAESAPLLHLNQKKSCCLSYMDQVLREIVESEEIYVEDLRQIIEGYLLQWRSLSDFCLSDRLDSLFGNIEAIYFFHKSFFKQLKECEFDALRVARCFLKNTSGFVVYADYCTNYPSTLSLLVDLMKVEDFCVLLRERQSALQHNLPLGSYLLKPVQRILKYHLLLQNVVREYSKLYHDDSYKDIVEALKTMTDIARHINDMKKQREQKNRVNEIKRLLSGWKGEDLVEFGELKLEGTFKIHGFKTVRRVFLFNKVVLITKEREGGLLEYKYHLKCSHMVLVESIPGETLSFQLIPTNDQKSHCLFQARNHEQKTEWTDLLKKVILENSPSCFPSTANPIIMGVRREDQCLGMKTLDNDLPERNLPFDYLKKIQLSKRKINSNLNFLRKSESYWKPKDQTTGIKYNNRLITDEKKMQERSKNKKNEGSKIDGHQFKNGRPVECTTTSMIRIFNKIPSCLRNEKVEFCLEGKSQVTDDKSVNFSSNPAISKMNVSLSDDLDEVNRQIHSTNLSLSIQKTEKGSLVEHLLPVTKIFRKFFFNCAKRFAQTLPKFPSNTNGTSISTPSLWSKESFLCSDNPEIYNFHEFDNMYSFTQEDLITHEIGVKDLSSVENPRSSFLTLQDRIVKRVFKKFGRRHERQKTDVLFEEYRGTMGTENSRKCSSTIFKSSSEPYFHLPGSPSLGARLANFTESDRIRCSANQKAKMI